MPEPRARRRLIEETTAELRAFIARVILRNQAIADQLGLHPVDLQCLNLIALAPSPLTAGEIARRAGLATSSTTRVLDRLEAVGYIERRRDTEDRRKVFIHPDPGRLSQIADIYRDQQAGIAAVTADVSERDLEAVLRFLRAAGEHPAGQAG